MLGPDDPGTVKAEHGLSAVQEAIDDLERRKLTTEPVAQKAAETRTKKPEKRKKRIKKKSKTKTRKAKAHGRVK